MTYLSKEQVLREVERALNRPDAPWQYSVQGDSIVGYWKWRDELCFNQGQASAGAKPYGFTVILGDNGTYRELDRRTQPPAGIGAGPRGANRPTGASYGTNSASGEPYAVVPGIDPTTGQAGLVRTAFDTEWVKRQLDEYLASCGWTKAPGSFGTLGAKVALIVTVAALLIAGIGVATWLSSASGDVRAAPAATETAPGRSAPAPTSTPPASTVSPESPGQVEPTPPAACPNQITPPEYVDAEVCGPIPADARAFAEFDSSTLTTQNGNITCELYEGDPQTLPYAYCQIDDYDFEPLYDEYGIESAAVELDTIATIGSASDSGDAEMLRIPAGTAVAVGDLACRFQEADVTCWNVETGHGSYLSRDHLAGW